MIDKKNGERENVMMVNTLILLEDVFFLVRRVSCFFPGCGVLKLGTQAVPATSDQRALIN